MTAIDQASFGSFPESLRRPTEGRVEDWIERSLAEKQQTAADAEAKKESSVGQTQEETRQSTNQVIRSPFYPIPLSPEAVRVEQMKRIPGTPESIFHEATELYGKADQLGRKNEKARGATFSLAA